MLYMIVVVVIFEKTENPMNRTISITANRFYSLHTNRYHLSLLDLPNPQKQHVTSLGQLSVLSYGLFCVFRRDRYKKINMKMLMKMHTKTLTRSTESYIHMKRSIQNYCTVLGMFY